VRLKSAMASSSGEDRSSWDNPRPLPAMSGYGDMSLYGSQLSSGNVAVEATAPAASESASSGGAAVESAGTLGTSGGVPGVTSASAGTGETVRPSLFSGTSSFSDFGSMFPRVGTSSGEFDPNLHEQFLREMQSDLARRMSERERTSLENTGEAGRTQAQLFSIGTPSDVTGSGDFYSVRSQASVYSHPTSSPVSFGPSTPIRGPTRPPWEAMSSPGGMSDVTASGGLPTSYASVRDYPPGLPLFDPPRTQNVGTFGVSLSDPDFGFSSAGLGSLPRPPYQQPPPPPPVGGPVGVDPLKSLLEQQSAMSLLMMQMAREMHQRSTQPQQSQANSGPTQQSVASGSTGPTQREMKMDEKWIPAMPVPQWKQWNSRAKELAGFKDWLEKFSGWLSLIQDHYGPELREALHSQHPIVINPGNDQQMMRSKRLFHLLQQNFLGYGKIENLVRTQITRFGVTDSNGFELLRIIRKEFSLLSRNEALGYRDQCLKFRVRRGDQPLPDVMREVAAEIESYHSMLEASMIREAIHDLRISEPDQFLLYMRNLPSKVQEFLTLTMNATTVNQVVNGVAEYYVRTRVQGDLGTVHLAHPVKGDSDPKDKTCYNCGKKGHLAANCPETKKCGHCGKKGHLEKDCWEKHPDKKPKPKPSAKSKNPFSKGKDGKDKDKKSGGRGRGRGRARGRGRGRVRNVEGEDGDDEQDDDYDDDYDEPEEDGHDDHEPEGEHTSDSVNQISQMTMVIKDNDSSRTCTECKPVGEQHRVDELNLVDKFQAIGSGDPSKRWLVDSGATCHIISERWLSRYKIVYKYDVGIPVLKGAGENVLPTRGMVDIECKVGKIKVVMRKVVVCALDLNVLSSYALHEQGWETRLGTLKVSGLYQKKVRFPLKISDRAWWLEVLVLKGKVSHGKNSGPQKMDIDHLGIVQETVPAKACSTKDVSAKVDPPEVDGDQATPLGVSAGTSEIQHVSAKENVGKFNNMRRECFAKSFDGLGPFSYVCRMVRFSEPNTSTTKSLQSEISGERREEASRDAEVLAGDLDFIENKQHFVEKCLEENKHYVFALKSDHFRGFPVEIDVDPEADAEQEAAGAGEHESEEDYEPSIAPPNDPEREQPSKRPRDGEDFHEEVMVPGPSDPGDEDQDDGYVPGLEGNLMYQHECHGHWPYDRGCDACVQARGRTPARRRQHKDNQQPIGLAADYTFVAGRHWRLLIMLMIHTGMLGIVVVTGNKENDVKSVASVLNEIGVGGLNVEVATDNENYLVDIMSRGLQKSNARSFHWRNISEYRPQAKGVERAVCIAKEGIYTNWLALEAHCQCRIALESPLLGYLTGYVYRTFNVFCEQNKGGTPLERMRGARGGQTPSSFPFGMLGFVKPIHLEPWRGQRLVLCCYLGLRYVTGGGVFAFPLNQDSHGTREVIRGHSFKIREGVQFDIQALWPLLSGVRPNDPNVAPPFVDPREQLEDSEELREPQVVPPPIAPAHDPMDDFPSGLPDAPPAGEPEMMDVELPGLDHEFSDDDMDVSCIDSCIHHYHQSVWNEFASKESLMEVGSTGTTFKEHFGGIEVSVEVPREVSDELTGLPLKHDQVIEGMRTEVKQLEHLKVGKNMTESAARKLAAEKKVKILTSRWVNTQKTPDLARCRLVVRDFASGAESAFRSGIYAPTSSLDSLRCVLALASLWNLWLITADVSTAFMYAEVEPDACDLVLLPSNITYRGERVVTLLFKAMNGLRRAPLLWFYQLQRTVYSLGGEDTFESTLFRLSTKKGLVLILVYVDDLLIASQDQQEGEEFLKKLTSIWKMKITGRIGKKTKGVLEFLGRTIYRSKDGESALYFGVSRQYMVGIFESWGENVKSGGTGLMPRLEDVYKESVKKYGEDPLTSQGEQRYRRVLGQLAWAALSRADLSFSISFLSRFQSKPNPAAEHCMRVFMKWLSTHLHFVQRMPAANCPHPGESQEIISFCDASWGVDSVSGAILVYKGCCVKFFSRKQEVPALSSAEAEIIAIVETAKEMVSLGMLLETMIVGIPLDSMGMPQHVTGSMALVMFNDANAAISIGKMDGLLRRVRHLELRVKYIQHLYKMKRISLTHWRGDENPSDGLTKSAKTAVMWQNLVDAVGLVPGPNDQGLNWIQNFLLTCGHFDFDESTTEKSGGFPSSSTETGGFPSLNQNDSGCVCPVAAKKGK